MSRKHEPGKPSQLWLLASEGQARHALVAEVALRVRSFKLYRYAVPGPLAQAVRPGVLVKVPYGSAGALREGWCVGVSRRAWDQTYKPIESVVSAEPLLDHALVELGRWVSEYYACPPGQTFDAIVPSILRRPRTRKVQYVRAAGRPPVGPLSKKQKLLLESLGNDELRRDEALRMAGVGVSTLQTLRKRGLIIVATREEPASPTVMPDKVAAKASEPPRCEEDAFALTAGQHAAIESIVQAADTPNAFKVFLLFGVPGSGKTEVYVRAIRRTAAAGRQAILLVPEIALATQVVQRLARRFERVAVLHSRLKASTREQTLRAIASGAVQVVIGTRTAVFAPCPRLGLIVVDEEQESSLKNLQAPFFHARDVAIKRGQIQRIPVVLGSATPALETWSNAQRLPHYQLLRLTERVPGARLPTVKVVRAAAYEPGQASDALSQPLADRLRETLEQRQQAILLHNRRGYAVYLRCASCGLMVCCQRCGSHMVYHRSDDRIKCHRCGIWAAAPTTCVDDTCRGRLKRIGLGIQRLEQELRRLFPDASLQRLDSDTMRRREDYADALTRFADREADILLGTQMVAKGLDFPEVRLVGVLDADAALWLPDFRAAERAFQLLVQVVGRAGRREGHSLALVQAENPAQPAIQAAVNLDYEAFADNELPIRRQFLDPPFRRLVRFICADPSAARARNATGELARRLRELAGKIHAEIRVDDAQAGVIPRLREMFRYQVVVRLPRDADSRRFLRAANEEKLLTPKVKRFTIDVDPIEML